jgi:hypothetical protein
MRKIVIAVLIAMATMATQEPIVWGGDHIEIQATAKAAAVEFDCAQGTIDAPLKADSNGLFEIKGTFTPQHAGPVRDDDSQTLKATYVGTIKEDAMSLRVTFAGKDAPPDLTFELVRGRRGNVRKCR